MTYGFAHRGGSHGPDNAIQTFVDALARGADGLETDAWLSLDGVVILDHDGVVPEMNGAPIAGLRRDELPARLATLDELYQRCGTDFAMSVDAKTPEVAAALVATAVRYRAQGHLWVVAPTPEALAAVGDGAHRAVTIRGNVLRSRDRAAALANAQAHGVEAVNARWMWWTRGLVEEVHALGLLAFGYDAQHSFSLRRSLAIELDGVFSDHVDRLVAALT